MNMSWVFSGISSEVKEYSMKSMLSLYNYGIFIVVGGNLCFCKNKQTACFGAFKCVRIWYVYYFKKEIDFLPIF